jgi:uncharacterized membrane protein YbhN (UPF0104 family)
MELLNMKNVIILFMVKNKKLLKSIVAILISFLLLRSVLPDLDTILLTLSGFEINYFLLIISSFFYILTYYLRGYRFSLFIKNSSFAEVSSIFNISQFLSNILPLRLGDLFFLKLKNKKNSIKKIGFIYLFQKTLDLLTIGVLFTVSFFVITKKLSMINFIFIYFILHLLIILIFIIFTQNIGKFVIKNILANKIINFAKEENKNIIISIFITSITWVIANIYAFLFLKSLSIKIYSLAETFFINSGTIILSIIPLPTLAGLGFIEYAWHTLSIVIIKEESQSYAIIALANHLFAILISFLLFLSSLIILNTFFKKRI